MPKYYAHQRFESLVPVSADPYLQFLKKRPGRLKPGELVLAIDFDFTITSPDSAGSFYTMPELRVYADTALPALYDLGWSLLIHSARFNHERFSERQRRRSQRHIEDVFSAYGMRFDRIWLEPGKPMATFYIDDRSFPGFPGWYRTGRVLADYMTVAEQIFALRELGITYAEAMRIFRANRKEVAA